MVDPNNANGPESRDKIKRFMGRTPGYFKSKFQSVLDSSNDLLNGISNRLEIKLNLSAPSEPDTNADDAEQAQYYSDFDDDDDDSIDENIIDFELRKVKERRAREEIKSGRYRQPNFITKNTSDEYNIVDINQKSSSSLSPTNSDADAAPSDATSPMREIHGEFFATNTFEATTISSRRDSMLVEQTKRVSGDGSENVSTTTSEHDQNIPSVSAASSDLNMWIHSDSDNSVPSWASSFSLDSQSEEATREFLRQFITILFADSTSITLELKADFGIKSRTEIGRLWFARLISAQRGRFKRVSESTFYALIQYFAIVLFECCESEDFSPAKILMNMCFTFYHEVDVPGCEPYREYLYIYLREQQIWQSLRFWNAAFFDALQCERVNRPVPALSSRPNCTIATMRQSLPQHPDVSSLKSEADSEPGSRASTSIKVNAGCSDEERSNAIKEDQLFHQNISFGQLGTFTCNMHAFGLSRQLCTEFLRKQCVIANLSRDQEKMLRDNINRMYKETAKWRT